MGAQVPNITTNRASAAPDATPRAERSCSAAGRVWFAGFLAFPLVGALIVWHRPDNRVGRLFLAVGVLQYGAAVTDGLAQHSVATGSPAGPLLVLAQNALFALAWVCATTYPLLLYPDGRLPTPRWRWAAHATTAAVAVLIASVVVTPGRNSEDDRAGNPLGVPGLETIAPAVTSGTLFLLLGLTMVGMASIVVRWRRAAGPDRERLAWLALAAVVFLVTTVAGLATDAWTPDWAGAALEAVGVAALPVATGVAVLRADLFDIAAVLDRAIVYSAPAAGAGRARRGRPGAGRHGGVPAGQPWAAGGDAAGRPALRTGSLRPRGAGAARRPGRPDRRRGTRRPARRGPARIPRAHRAGA
ncbi:hypothetical protein [Nonomuraea aridisoli]|uniref:hypothetical protein n=1 Tax=Nonomuraea aridisoli TaxID=2070368 RepID=UPI0015E8CFE1|nr:hypothetical protein [Nonomuraea aridisoli]